ncbi:hypothetical protein D9M68_677540 [compost metagenome]
MRFIIFISIRHFAEVASAHCFVDTIDAGNPVTILRLVTLTLVIILTTGIVPHKVSPEHVINLVTHEETEVISACRLFAVRQS